jgi:hypothetical protein
MIAKPLPARSTAATRINKGALIGGSPLAAPLAWTRANRTENEPTMNVARRFCRPPSHSLVLRARNTIIVVKPGTSAEVRRTRPDAQSFAVGRAISGPVLASSGLLLLFRTVIYRSCQTRREGTQAEGALPATVAPAGEVRGTGRQARPFLFGGVSNLLRIAAAKLLGNKPHKLSQRAGPLRRWFKFGAANAAPLRRSSSLFPKHPRLTILRAGGSARRVGSS